MAHKFALQDRPLGEARTKEIRHEAAVLARTVIQTTLVCLGGTTPHVSVGPTLDIVESIVNNVKELEAYSKDSTSLSPYHIRLTVMAEVGMTPCSITLLIVHG